MRSTRHVLHVSTDVSSLRFELDDSVYVLHDKRLDIPVRPGVYHYRAAYTVDGKRIVLTNSLDFTSRKDIDLKLNFSIYNNKAVLKAICESLDKSGGSDCPFQLTVQRTDFVEDYQWAIVSLSSPEVGPSMAVLQIDNGSWKVVDGPATDIQTGGYFPESVEKVIENER